MSVVAPSANARLQRDRVSSRVDFDLHGILRVRLIDPAPCDLRAVRTLLGEPTIDSAALQCNGPTIQLRFVDQWETPELTYLGLHATAFAEDQFYLLNNEHGQIEAAIPFDTIGDSCEIRFCRGAGRLPLLDDLLRFTLLKQGYLPLHASAVYHAGQGVLIVAWAKGGKTETLLALAKHGAEYVGDEVVYLTPDGARMFGLSIPITLWSWQLPHIRDLLPTVRHGQRLFFAAVQGLEVLKSAVDGPWIRKRLPGRLLTKLLQLAKEQTRLVVAPQTLFGARQRSGFVAVDKVILAMSHADPTCRIEAVDATEITGRMAHSNAYEENYFMKHYQAFAFAFPQRRNLWLEQATAQEAAMLARALRGKACYKLVHPYPVAIDQLSKLLQPFVTGSPACTEACTEACAEMCTEACGERSAE